MKILTQKDLASLLKKKNVRVTDHRLAILTYLVKAKKPVTVQELVLILHKKFDIDVATVYRNVSSLQAADIIRRFDYNHGHAHYELKTSEASHSFICNNCETIEKIEGVPVGETIKKLVKRSKKFKSVTTYSIEIYGVCKNCC